MTINTREEARCIMRQCEGLERYLSRVTATMTAMEEEYDDLMCALDAYFLTDEQRKALDYFDGNSRETYDLAVNLGVDPDFAEWLYL